MANGQNIDYSEKENGPRASSAPALGLNTIIFKHVYWYMLQISGERLQEHWSSGFLLYTYLFSFIIMLQAYMLIMFSKSYIHLKFVKQISQRFINSNSYCVTEKYREEHAQAFSFHYENTSMQYTEIFRVVKNLKFH